MLPHSIHGPDGKGWWWLSYASPKGFLFATVVRADHFHAALKKAEALEPEEEGAEILGTLPASPIVEDICEELYEEVELRRLSKAEGLAFEKRVERRMAASGYHYEESN